MITLFMNAVLLTTGSNKENLNISFTSPAYANINVCTKSGEFYMGQFKNLKNGFCLNASGDPCGEKEKCTLDSDGGYCQELICI